MKKLGFGMMRLPLLNEEDKKSIDKKTVCQMVDTFMERDRAFQPSALLSDCDPAPFRIGKLT